MKELEIERLTNKLKKEFKPLSSGTVEQIVRNTAKELSKGAK